MSPVQPPVIPYSSGQRIGQEPQKDGQAVLAGALLLLLLGCFYFAFWQFYSDQMGLFYWIDRGMYAVGYENKNPAEYALVFLGLTPPRPNNLGITLLTFYEDLVLSLAGLPFAASFGLFISPALFQWRSKNVRWVAASVPFAAGLWRAFVLIARSAAVFTVNSGGFAGTTPPATGGIGPGVLALAVFLQVVVAFLAGWFARPVAIWLAGLLLPDSRSSSLRALWTEH